MSSFNSEHYQYAAAAASGIDNYPHFFVEQTELANKKQNFNLSPSSDFEMLEAQNSDSQAKIQFAGASQFEGKSELSTKIHQRHSQDASTKHLQSLVDAENELQSIFSAYSSQSSSTGASSFSQYEVSPTRGCDTLPQLNRICSDQQKSNNLLISRPVNPHVRDSAFIKQQQHTQSAKSSPLSVKLIKPTAVRSTPVANVQQVNQISQKSQEQFQSSRFLNFQGMADSATNYNQNEFGQDLASFTFDISPPLQFGQPAGSCWTNNSNMMYYENPIGFNSSIHLPPYAYCEQTTY